MSDEPQSATLYTIAQIEDVSGQLMESTGSLSEAMARAYLKGRPPVHLTWRDRLRARRWDYEERIRIAVDALRGRHDCGGW